MRNEEDSLTETVNGIVGDELSLFDRMVAGQQTLRSSERRVAELILQDPESAVGLTMAAVARRAGVSEPTVKRFCNHLGYEGYKAFRVALAQAVALGLPLTDVAITAHDDIAEVATKVFNHSISSLDRVRRRLDMAALAQAAEMLNNAEEIVFVGFGASGIVAVDAEQKFSMFRPGCVAPTDPHQMFMRACMATPSSVFVAVSNTGRSTTVLDIVRMARSRGAAVIGITGQEQPELAEHCDITLVTQTFENTEMFTPTVSRLAALVVVDILSTVALTALDKEHLTRLRWMKTELRKFRARGGPNEISTPPGHAEDAEGASPQAP